MGNVIARSYWGFVGNVIAVRTSGKCMKHMLSAGSLAKQGGCAKNVASAYSLLRAICTSVEQASAVAIFFCEREKIAKSVVHV